MPESLRKPEGCSAVSTFSRIHNQSYCLKRSLRFMKITIGKCGHVHDVPTTYIPTYIHTYIHYIHTYIHTYTHSIPHFVAACTPLCAYMYTIDYTHTHTHTPTRRTMPTTLCIHTPPLAGCLAARRGGRRAFGGILGRERVTFFSVKFVCIESCGARGAALLRGRGAALLRGRGRAAPRHARCSGHRSGA